MALAPFAPEPVQRVETTPEAEALMTSEPRLREIVGEVRAALEETKHSGRIIVDNMGDPNETVDRVVVTFLASVPKGEGMRLARELWEVVLRPIGGSDRNRVLLEIIGESSW